MLYSSLQQYGFPAPLSFMESTKCTKSTNNTKFFAKGRLSTSCLLAASCLCCLVIHMRPRLARRAGACLGHFGHLGRKSCDLGGKTWEIYHEWTRSVNPIQNLIKIAKPLIIQRKFALTRQK